MKWILPPIFRSVRLTLTLWYAGILSLILCGFGWVLYLQVRTSLVKDIDQRLESRAMHAVDTLHSYWEAVRTTALNAPGNWERAPSSDLTDMLRKGRLELLIERWARETMFMNAEHAVRLLDDKGQAIVHSRGFDDLNLDEVPSIPVTLVGDEPIYQTREMGGKRLRFLSYAVMEKGRLLYGVQVLDSLEAAETSLARLRTWLAWFIPAVLLLAISVGWFLASIALRPIDLMITQAQRIGEASLGERLSISRTDDALERLAITFNDMLDRLERSFRRLRHFSAAASHELRTPLTVMRGELEVALRRPRENEEYRRVLRTHLHALEDMSHTVEQLLLVARSDQQGSLERAPLEVSQLATHVCERLDGLAHEKNIDLSLQAPETAWVLGERRLIDRLLSNLIENAIRYTPSPGSIRVEVARYNTTVGMIVSDTGPGIPKEEYESIFDRFFTRSSTTISNRHKDSTGLGLGLCRWIAEAHQGRIDVSSQLGKGATFTVRLPMTLPPRA